MACGKLVASCPCKPVQRLLVEDHGDAEARVVLHPPLDRVGELRLRTRPVAVARALDPADPHPEPLRRAGGVEAPLGVGDLRLGVPEAHHLRHLLLRASCARGGPPRVAPSGARGSGSPDAPLPLPLDGPGREEGTEHQQARQAVVSHQVLGAKGVSWGTAREPRAGGPRGPASRLLSGAGSCPSGTEVIPGPAGFTTTGVTPERVERPAPDGDTLLNVPSPPKPHRPRNRTVADHAFRGFPPSRRLGLILLGIAVWGSLPQARRTPPRPTLPRRGPSSRSKIGSPGSAAPRRRWASGPTPSSSCSGPASPGSNSGSSGSRPGAAPSPRAWRTWISGSAARSRPSCSSNYGGNDAGRAGRACRSSSRTWKDASPRPRGPAGPGGPAHAPGGR